MYAVGYSEHEQSRYRFFPLYIAHTSAYFCYKSNRIWHEPQNIAETSGTWYITNDNGFVLPRNRGYAVFGNGEV